MSTKSWQQKRKKKGWQTQLGSGKHVTLHHGSLDGWLGIFGCFEKSAFLTRILASPINTHAGGCRGELLLLILHYNKVGDETTRHLTTYLTS